jgi:hypothetical protein
LKLAYVAGKYSAPTPEEIEQNVMNAAIVASQIIDKGYSVVCPHTNSHLLESIKPREHQEWLDIDFAILAKCDLCVMVHGWEKSKGAVMESQFCVANGIPIVYDVAFLPDAH